MSLQIYKLKLIMLHYLPLICASIVSAIIMFQTILIAPAINKRINSKEASIFLRFIWPKFFIIIGVISLISTVCLFFFNIEQNLAKICSISSVVLMVICYILTPIINNAKDKSDDKTWTILHLSTVIMTSLVLILNIISIFLFM